MSVKISCIFVVYIFHIAFKWWKQCSLSDNPFGGSGNNCFLSHHPCGGSPSQHPTFPHSCPATTVCGSGTFPPPFGTRRNQYPSGCLCTGTGSIQAPLTTEPFLQLLLPNVQPPPNLLPCCPVHHWD